MSGLSRFDFYPRDWHLDTRDLTNAAKGVYIDLLASIYARGGAIPADERELCRICGCATARSPAPSTRRVGPQGQTQARKRASDQRTGDGGNRQIRAPESHQ